MPSFNYPATDQANAVSGPEVATDNAIARFNGTSGEIIQNSPGTAIDDDGDTTVKSLTATDFTATTVPIVNGSKKLESSAVTPTELGRLSGVTSAVQTQLNTLTTNLASEVTNRAADVDAEETRALAAESTLQTNITTVSNALTTHESDTSTHGVGEIVGRTEAQTLTNKTLTSPVINSPTGIVKGDVGLGNVDNTSDATKNAAAVTLTNKTIDADSNTISNISNAQIKAAAGIDAAKIADGSVSNTEFQYISTLGSNAQTQLDAKKPKTSVTTTAITADTTLTSATADVRVINHSAAVVITLDNSFTSDRRLTLINKGTADVTVKANDATIIQTLYRGGCVTNIQCLHASAPATNTDWQVCQQITSPPIERAADFAFSAGFGTLAAKFVTVKRQGKMAVIEGLVRYGTLAASTASFDLPSGMTIDSDFYQTSHTNGLMLGMWFPLRDTSTSIIDNGNSGVLFWSGSDADTIFLALNCGFGGAEQFSVDNGTTVFGSDHDAAFTFRAQIYINEWEEFSG